MIETGRWINRYTINLYFTPLRHPKKTPTFDVKKKTHSKKQSFWYKVNKILKKIRKNKKKLLIHLKNSQ